MKKVVFIDHIVIIVKDIEETEKFYKAFLGDPIQQDNEQIAYQVGKTKIFFGLPYTEWEQSDKDKGGLNHLAFGAKTGEELRELGETLDEAGIKHSGVQIDKYGQKEFIWFDDPNGVRLEFYCRSH